MRMISTTSALVALGAIAGSAIAETVHGVVVFTRHGDRNSKHYSGYGLTSLGFQQNNRVGNDYRNRYISASSPSRIFNISESKYVPAQIYASAPDQSILVNTATAFLQGLYPPLTSIDPQLATTTLNNGTATQNPLNGYQYVFLKSANANSPDTIWIKGSEGCPAFTSASEAFEASPQFKSNVESTRSFYSGFWDILQNVADYTPAKLTYAKAYDIFDLVNTASIHNRSIPRNVSSQDLFQLRTLADSAEFGYNFNASQPTAARSIGAQTFAGAVLNQLNQTVTSKGKVKFSLLAGSYNTFLAFFGLANLTSVNSNFYGLPDYAATMAFELFTAENSTAFPSDANSLNVRFLFRNGSTGTLTSFPLFGTTSEYLSWPDFITQMKSRAVTSAEKWCSLCSSTEPFCVAYKGNAAGSSNGGSKSGGELSNAVAGVIGAVVTLAVLLLVGVVAFVLLRRRKSRSRAAPVMERKTSGSDSGSA